MLDGLGDEEFGYVADIELELAGEDHLAEFVRDF